MKAFIFDPLWDELITNGLKNQLVSSGIQTVVTKEIAPLSDCKELFEGDEERILCLNPDKYVPAMKQILNELGI